MEPQIRYVKSADGTRIAMSTLGQGRPLVLVPAMWLTTLEMYWQLPQIRANLERLAERRMVVLYDSRGYGLSEREVTDFSLEARVGDLTAVVDSLDAPMDLLAQVSGGPTAISYIVKHPERIRRLCLQLAVARGRDLIVTPRQRALRHLLEVDWELYVQTQVLVVNGWTEFARGVAESLIGAVTAEVFLASGRATRQDDVTELLPKVRCPTLVIQERNEQIVSISTSRQLAAAIPNARLALVALEEPWPLANEAALQIIEEFLDEGAEAPNESQLPSGTAIILFADVVDSTALTERLGDAVFRAKARELGGSLRAVIRECAGTPVEGPTLGDGVLAAFTSAREAIEAARRCGKAGDDAGLPLHLGLHAGDVTREKDPDGRDNVYGGAVNIAARISGLSAPGEVLVSDVVRTLARTSAGVTFEDRGERELKGIGEPVRVWAVSE